MKNCLVGVLALLTLTVSAAEDLSKQHARSAPEWLRNGVVHEIFPRNFSPEGNFNGITARLDELKSLGVDILSNIAIAEPSEAALLATGGVLALVVTRRYIRAENPLRIHRTLPQP